VTKEINSYHGRRKHLRRIHFILSLISPLILPGISTMKGTGAPSSRHKVSATIDFFVNTKISKIFDKALFLKFAILKSN